MITEVRDTKKNKKMFNKFLISGTNNSYQVKSKNSLASLYSTSTMEHHHFDQCLMLLNTNGNQLLANVSKVNKKYKASTT